MPSGGRFPEETADQAESGRFGAGASDVFRRAIHPFPAAFRLHPTLRGSTRNSQDIRARRAFRTMTRRKRHVSPDGDDPEAREAHRVAVKELQKAIDATMDGGDEETHRVNLRRAREKEEEAHQRLEKSRKRAPPK